MQATNFQNKFFPDPDGFDNHSRYVQFWLNLFPRLVPELWRAKQPADHEIKWTRANFNDDFACMVLKALDEQLQSGNLS